VAGFFCTIEVALQFDINVFAAKNAGETFNGSAGFVCSAVSESVGEEAIIAAGKADQAVGKFGEVFFTGGNGGRISVLGSTHFHAGDQAAEVLVAGARGDEERQVVSGFTTETRR